VGAAFVLAFLQLPDAAQASELSYTYLDFMYADQTVDATGNQQPVFGQNIFVDAEQGDSIAMGGSLGLGKRFFLSGSFASSIIDVTATVTSPLAEVTVTDNFDVISSRLSLGYVQPLGDAFDLLFEVTYDSLEFDFGSFAGESFDVEDSGAGAQIGFRWNPTRALELYASSRFSPVGKVTLDDLEFDSDVINRVGLMWYFFEDLGVGLDYESGQVESFSVSMRFSFGTLQW
jgi:hypothetical protein